MNNDLNIKVVMLSEGAKIPRFAHTTDTGFDLYTSEDFIIGAKKTGAVPTGLAFELPEGYGIMVRPRSGNTLRGVIGKYKPILKELDPIINGSELYMDIKVQIGTIDQDYRGEIKILATNNEAHSVLIPKGTKLAQGVIEKVYKANFEVVNELTDTIRGNNGFGSTGK